jgi:mono/diheme cytochrome c family protein
MKDMRMIIAAVALAGTVSAALAQHQRGPTHATVPGAGTTNVPPKRISFTQEQANRGKTAYMVNCSACHGADLGGQYGPALAGPNTNISWQTGADLWGYTIEMMPVGNAGGLPQTDYLNIVAYVLQQNGQHPGKQALTAQSIAHDTHQIGGAAR